MCYDKIFTASLTNNTWIGFIHPHIFTNRFPHFIEYSCAAGKVNTCKIGMIKNHFTNGRAINKYKVDHTIR